MGAVQALPAFSEFVRLPLKWFMQPAPRVVEYVASVHGLTADERKRFEDVIAIYHNCERYERLTGRAAPLNREQLAKAMLRA